MDPRPLFLQSLNIDECRIQYQRTLFLCGGRFDFKSFDYFSIRQAILSYNTQKPKKLNSNVMLAELCKGFRDDGIFSDLIAFENHLAGIARAVVIILESPGALAEFGAFFQNEKLFNKLLVLVQNRHLDPPSFINLGFLPALRRKNPESVKCYPWEDDDIATISEDLIDAITDDIEAFMSATQSSAVLDRGDEGHQTVFIWQLLKLFVALKEGELIHFSELLGFDISQKRLRQILYILQEFEFVSKVEYGSPFYFAKSPDFHTLRLVLKDANAANQNIQTDIIRRCTNFYNSTSGEKNRKNAINLAIREGLLE